MKHKEQKIHQNCKQVRKRVRKAFANLRSQGFLAFMNHKCCTTCSCNDLMLRANSLKSEGKEIPTGIAYYHARDYAQLKRNGQLHIRYSELRYLDHSRPTTKEVGRIVRTALDKAGLITEWNGDPNKTIFIAGFVEDEC